MNPGPDPAPHQSVRICDYKPIYPPMLHFEHLKLLNVDFTTDHDLAFTLMRIRNRIQLFTVPDQDPDFQNKMRIHADPDPKPCYFVSNKYYIPQILECCSNPGSSRLPSAATAGTSLPRTIDTALKGLPYEISVFVLWPKIESGHSAKWALRHYTVDLINLFCCSRLAPTPTPPQQASQ